MLYRPKTINELRTPVKLLKPTYTAHNGVNRAAYPADGDVLFVNWKTYGGTETTVNGVYSVLDTADVTTWYRPDITAGCRLLREDNTVFEIISAPENVDGQNVFCTFKVERVKGGV
jgi:hypothetical protein